MPFRMATGWARGMGKRRDGVRSTVVGKMSLDSATSRGREIYLRARSSPYWEGAEGSYGGHNHGEAEVAMVLLRGVESSCEEETTKYWRGCAKGILEAGKGVFLRLSS